MRANARIHCSSAGILDPPSKTSYVGSGLEDVILSCITALVAAGPLLDTGAKKKDRWVSVLQG